MLQYTSTFHYRVENPLRSFSALLPLQGMAPLNNFPSLCNWGYVSNGPPFLFINLPMEFMGIKRL